MEGVQITSLLPHYVEESLTKSSTVLLLEYNVSIGVRKFNLLLNRLGYLEKMTRKSSSKKGKIKSFWNLTEKGLEFGKNLISQRNEKETQPHYYINKFNGLLKGIGII